MEGEVTTGRRMYVGSEVFLVLLAKTVFLDLLDFMCVIFPVAQCGRNTSVLNFSCVGTVVVALLSSGAHRAEGLQGKTRPHGN